MKKMILALSLVATLNGCAASYVQYDVSGSTDGCAPRVHADTAMGVSVTVNDDFQCQQKTKPKEQQNSE